MPDESCRTCGGELTKCTVCAECRKPVTMICVQCWTRTLEQVHDLCFRPKNINQNLTAVDYVLNRVVVA